VFGHGYFFGEAAFGRRGSTPRVRKHCRVRMFPDRNFAMTMWGRAPSPIQQSDARERIQKGDIYVARTWGGTDRSEVFA